MGLLLFNVSCDDDDDNDESPIEMGNSIVDVAVANEDLSILVTALQRVGLDDDLDGDGSYTVFAPTNDAFLALLDELGASSLDDVSDSDLTDILLYHVLSGENTSSMIESGYYSTLSASGIDGYGLSLFVDMDDAMINNRASIAQTDIDADNGVIHIIDKVILPMSITDHAMANSEFSALVAAVSKAELVETLDDAEGMYTVFAPTNDALATFLEENDLTLEELSKEDLTPILLYHVLNDAVTSSMVESGYVGTLSTAFDNNISLKVDVEEGVMLNSEANVIATNVIATNGIIHVIDKVITPPSIVDIAMQNISFSTLVDAVVKAGLVDALSGAGPLTVFAPTNDAFNALFTELGVSGLDELTAEDLTPILLAHVVEGNVLSTDLNNGMVSTLNSEKSLDINVDNGVVIDDAINVDLADIQGENGVIHVIDKVIVP